MRGLPRGLDTILGEAGRTVSAGQARRLCLARTLLSHAPVLLLDEPTNGLDRETELAFFETLKTATTGRTVVLVTHAAIPEGTVERVVEIRMEIVELWRAPSSQLDCRSKVIVGIIKGMVRLPHLEPMGMQGWSVTPSL